MKELIARRSDNFIALIGYRGGKVYIPIFLTNNKEKWLQTLTISYRKALS